MIIFKSLHARLDLMDETLASLGQFLEDESRGALRRSNEIDGYIKDLAASQDRSNEKLEVLVTEVASLLAKVAEYMKQNEELTKNLARLAKMEADLVAERVAKADLPVPTEFDKIF
jgi:uncharacterized protein involved in exopolysaccharide biosynthesis